MPANYHSYVNSPAWEERKIAYYAKHARRCKGCGTTDDVDLHHHTYKRLGAERDTDLVPVCESCHDTIHRLHKERGGSLTAATFDALRFLSDERTPQPRARSEEFIPRNQRGSTRDSSGRVISTADWREGAMRNVPRGTR